MSIDPETLRQIEELSQDDRPLLVLDVDDVLLDFIKPFPQYLRSRGYHLKLGSFRLHGNVFDIESGSETAQEDVAALLDAFFDVQTNWQTLVEGAADTISDISREAEVILLTAMPHRHRATRRAHLDTLGLDYPLLTTEMEKGPAIKRLRGQHNRPVAFVDDMPKNLVSARESVNDAHLFHLMADNSLRNLLPPPPDHVTVLHDWHEAKEHLSSALGI